MFGSLPDIVQNSNFSLGVVQVMREVSRMMNKEVSNVIDSCLCTMYVCLCNIYQCNFIIPRVNYCEIVVCWIEVIIVI